MRKTQIAESVLMLVTSRERAAAIAGDLVEESPGRGAWWLWWSVLRTAGSLLWRGLGADPLQLAGLALRGVLLNFALWLAAFVSFVAAGALIFGLLQTAGLVHGDSASFPRAAEAFFTVVGLAIQFQIGRWMARRAADRALAACVLFVVETTITTAVSTALFLAWLLATFHKGAAEPETLLDFWLPYGAGRPLLDCVPLMAGAWWVRRRSIEPAGA